LESAVAGPDILVLDAELAVPTVNHIAEHARINRKPLFMSIGSALAGTRTWLHSNTANTAVCLSGRSQVIRSILSTLKAPQAEIEAFRAFVATGEPNGTFDINQICRQLKTTYLVCSNVQQSEDVRHRMQQGKLGWRRRRCAGRLHSVLRAGCAAGAPGRRRRPDQR
jgi:hypothetical protein